MKELWRYIDFVNDYSMLLAMCGIGIKHLFHTLTRKGTPQ